VTSRLIKLACATALAMPLVGTVGMSSAHAWDCYRPYGAITSHPTCDEVGMRFHHHHHHGFHGGGYGPWAGGGGPWAGVR